MKLSRRSLLCASTGALALGTVAGCLSEPGEDGSPGETEGYAAFFTLWDWTEEIVGDEIEITNPVDVGEMGHGWEPPADLQRNVAGSDVFVYLDTPEFSWAQDIADEIADEDVDTVLIDAMGGLENQLLPMNEETEADREPADAEFDPETVSIGDFAVYDGQTGDETADWHIDHWHGELPAIPVDGSAAVEGIFEDDEGRVLPVGTDEQFQFDARIVDGANEDVLEIASEGDEVIFHGEETGRTRVVFELVADGEVVWDTSADNVTAEVVEELGDDAAPDFYDPHVWADPVLAQRMVETIADGLGEADPDNAELYAANAADYVERLEDVHDQFEQLAADA
ncbi:metal ABC transporter substrate-binding protein, partial [Natronobacterium gregoryi]